MGRHYGLGISDCVVPEHACVKVGRWVGRQVSDRWGSRFVSWDV